MNTKLILIEGIPGSGKTTIAKKISEYLKAKGINERLYLEDDYNPTDLKWHALVSYITYKDILEKYSDISEDIIENTVWDGEQAIISFNKISYPDQSFYQEMDRYEIYNGRIPLNEFCQILRARWAEFGREAEKRDELTIFEGAFLQSMMNDLLAVHNIDTVSIYKYLETLIDCVRKLNPFIIYLNPGDVEETIQHIAEERISANGQPEWIDMAKSYIEWVPFGKKHGLKGFDGVVEYSRARQRIELGFLDFTPVKSAIISVNHDYDQEFEAIKYILDANII